MKTCSEICIDADNNSDNLNRLSSLWNYVIKNKREYPLVQLKFILEHIENHVKTLATNDARQLKQILTIL